MLEELGIEYEMTIISAHREPDEFIECDESSRRPWNQSYDRRCRNGSSIFRECVQHYSPLPVIGVPMSGKNLDGHGCSCSQSCRCRRESRLQPLRSTEAKNAAILAAKILAASDEELLKKLKAYTAEHERGSTKPKQQSLILSDMRHIWHQNNRYKSTK